MFYDIYGVQYKKKLDEIFPKLRPVFQHKVQEERTIANKADDSQNGKACRLKIENEKPLTLPVVYEICRQLKCTPGCVFGYKGEYEEEKKPINLEEQNLTSIYFDNNTKHVDVKFLPDPFYLNKDILEERPDVSIVNRLATVGNAVVYDEEAEILRAYRTNRQTPVPKQIYTYILEKIDVSKECPFYVNGEWRKSIYILFHADMIPVWERYCNNGWIMEKSEWERDKTTGKRIVVNDEFVKHFVPTHLTSITSRMLYQGFGKQLKKKKECYDFVNDLIASKKEVFLFFKLDDSYEKISHIKYEDEKENYKAG